VVILNFFIVSSNTFFVDFLLSSISNFRFLQIAVTASSP
jgi:hypothetical protein